MLLPSVWFPRHPWCSERPYQLESGRYEYDEQRRPKNPVGRGDGQGRVGQRGHGLVSVGFDHAVGTSGVALCQGRQPDEASRSLPIQWNQATRIGRARDPTGTLGSVPKEAPLIGPRKRRGDFAQVALGVVADATSDERPPEVEKDSEAFTRGRQGGQARAAKLAPERRSEIARQARVARRGA